MACTLRCHSYCWVCVTGWSWCHYLGIWRLHCSTVDHRRRIHWNVWSGRSWICHTYYPCILRKYIAGYVAELALVFLQTGEPKSTKANSVDCKVYKVGCTDNASLYFLQKCLWDISNPSTYRQAGWVVCAAGRLHSCLYLPELLLLLFLLLSLCCDPFCCCCLFFPITWLLFSCYNNSLTILLLLLLLLLFRTMWDEAQQNDRSGSKCNVHSFQVNNNVLVLHPLENSSWQFMKCYIPMDVSGSQKKWMLHWQTWPTNVTGLLITGSSIRKSPVLLYEQESITPTTSTPVSQFLEPPPTAPASSSTNARFLHFVPLMCWSVLECFTSSVELGHVGKSFQILSTFPQQGPNFLLLSMRIRHS